MSSSLANPHSKPGIYTLGSPSLPTSATAAGNSTIPGTSTSQPGSYTQPNGHTQAVGRTQVPVALPTRTTARIRATPRPALEQRDSVLRASIFDTALELGVGTSSAVDRWIFGAIGEEDEEADETIGSPGLTYASTATSDESWLHSSTSSSSQQSAGQRPVVATTASARTVQFAPPRQSPPGERETSFDSSTAPVSVDFNSSNPLHKGNKLRKARPHDGYASDDGYISEGGTSSKNKSKKSSKKEKKEKGDESEGGYLSDVFSRRKRNKEKKKSKTKPDALNLEADADGEETDGGYLSSGVASFVRSRKGSTSKPKKGKAKSNDPGAAFSPQSGAEESDGGYLSSSSVKKRRFFGLRRGDSEDAPRSSKESIPPVPALPRSALSTPSPVDGPPRSLTPLPIAERYTSRSNTPLPRSETATPSSSISLHVPSESLTSSRSATPVSVMTARASGSSENDRPADVEKLIPPALPSPNPSMASLDSPRLTRAFGDAESVRSPSIDVLRAFGRQAGLNMRDADVKAYLNGGGRALSRLREDEHSSLASTSYGSLRTAAESGFSSVDRDGPTPSTPDVPASRGEDDADPLPTLNLPSPSAQMKRTLSKKQTPAPLTGLGPSTLNKGMGGRDIRSYEVLQVNGEDATSTAVNGNDSSEDEDNWDDRDLMVDVIPATPDSGRSRASGPIAPLSPTRRRSPSPTLPSSPARPVALAKYDLPPPSPPPSRPLPRTPPPALSASPLTPSPSLPTSPSKSNFSVDLQAGSGKVTGRTPSSPLGKSSFTPEDIQIPTPATSPSPTRPGFLSRKVSKRPGTAPEAPNLSAMGPESAAQAGYFPAFNQPVSPSAPHSAAGAISKAFGFGRRLPSRPGTAPTSVALPAPPTSFNAANAGSGSSSLSLKRVSSNSSITSLGGGAIQRGRESPFPSRPVLPPGQRSRAASPVQLVIDRQHGNNEQPLSAGAVLQQTVSRSTDQKLSPVQTLDVHWQPRSASALDSRAPPAGRSASPSFTQSGARPADDYDDRSSWVDFDDSPPSSPDGRNNYIRDSKFSGSKRDDARRSYESQESRPDIDSVLGTLNGDDEPLQYGRESQYSHTEDQSHYPDDDDYDDPRERETAYYTSVSAFASDAEDVPSEPVPPRPKNLTVNTTQFAGRYSTSPSPSPTEFDDDADELEYRKSRASIMDPKRSERVRQKLMQRVEKMRREGEQSAGR